MPIVLPETPQFGESISREQALDMHHHADKYIEFYKKNNPNIPKDKDGLGWPLFLEDPERYKRNLLGFGLGFGMNDADGNWMKRYQEMIPAKELFKKRNKPRQLNARISNPEKLERLNRELLQLLQRKNESTQTLGRNYGDFGRRNEFDERINKLERKITELRKGERVQVPFEAAVKNPEKYGSFLKADEDYFKEALEIHVQLQRKNDPLFSLSKDNPGLFHEKIGVKQLRSMTAAVMGDAAEPLEGQSHVIGEERYAASFPEVVKTQAGVPYLLYGLNNEETGDPLEFLMVQDVRHGHVDAYHYSDLLNVTELPCKNNLEIALKNIHQKIVVQRPKEENEKPASEWHNKRADAFRRSL